MTEHKATPHHAEPEVWAVVERLCKNGIDTLNCTLELRARVEALEAGLTTVSLELRDRLEALEATAKPAESNDPAEPDSSLIDEARAYLAQPKPQAPSKHELFGLLMQSGGANRVVSIEWLEPFAHAVLARWGRSSIKPVPVSERLPKPEDCDAEGRCWWGRPSEELCNSDWFLATRAEVDEFCDAWPPIVFLPHWALPVPTKAS